MIYLRGEHYTMQASDKISEACKYPLAFFSVSQPNKYSNLGKIGYI